MTLPIKRSSSSYYQGASTKPLLWIWYLSSYGALKFFVEELDEEHYLENSLWYLQWNLCSLEVVFKVEALICIWN